MYECNWPGGCDQKATLIDRTKNPPEFRCDTHTPTPKHLFSEEDVEAAMCIWEFSLMNQGKGQDHVFKWLAGGEGAASARQQCIELAKDLELSYQVARETGYDTCFDWEFVPRWVILAMAVTEHFDLTPGWIDWIGREIAIEFKRENAL